MAWNPPLPIAHPNEAETDTEAGAETVTERDRERDRERETGMEGDDEDSKAETNESPETNAESRRPANRQEGGLRADALERP